MFKYLLNKLASMLSNNIGALGLTGDQVSLYRKDMYKAEREGMMEIPPMYPKIFKVVSGKEVTGAGNKHTQLLSAGALTRHTTEGQDIEFNSPVEGWTTLVKYHTYSDGLSFSPEAIEDTVKLGNLLKELANTWGQELRVAKETMASTVFNDGSDLLGNYVFNGTHAGNTDSSGNLMYDSEPLFNLTGNTRSTKGGGTYYNSISGLTVTPDDFETMYNLMTKTNNRDEQDRIKSNPVDTMLTEPGADHFKARRILETVRGLPNSEVNDINPYSGLIINIWKWDYLSDSAFYVGKAQHKDFQFHERMSPVIRFFRNENNAGYKASIRVRFGVFLRAGSWKAWGKGGGTYA